MPQSTAGGAETGSRRGLVPPASARESSHKELEQLKMDKHLLKEEIATMQSNVERLASEEKSLKSRVDALQREADRLQAQIERLQREKASLEQSSAQAIQQSGSQLQLPQPLVRPASGQGRSMRVNPDTLRGLKRSDLPSLSATPPVTPTNGAEPNPNIPLTRKVGFW